MAAHPIVVVEHGRVEIPEELKQQPQFSDGAKLQLVPVSALNKPLSMEREIRSWRDLEGILADSPFDPNAELEADKQRELRSEGR